MDTSERWRKFDCKELTRQYSPSQWALKKADEVVKIHMKNLKEGTELARSTVECELGIKLGEPDLHKFDVFGRKDAKAGTPALIYIHGGYWQALGLEYANFAAINITKAGGVLYSVGYSIAPHGTIEQMIDEVKKGICHVLKDAESRNFSSVYLCGHSAGAHLTSMMLTVDWEAEGVNSKLLKGVILLSGVYDLRPLVNTYVNDLLKMTEESASQISPQLIHDRIIKYSKDRYVFVVVGKYDSEEFIRQAQHFADTLRSASCNVYMRVVSDCDHFTVVERLMDTDYEITQEILHLMGLT